MVRRSGGAPTAFRTSGASYDLQRLLSWSGRHGRPRGLSGLVKVVSCGFGFTHTSSTASAPFLAMQFPIRASVEMGLFGLRAVRQLGIWRPTKLTRRVFWYRTSLRINTLPAFRHLRCDAAQCERSHWRCTLAFHRSPMAGLVRPWGDEVMVV